MVHFDASRADVIVYSFKDGVLAKLAHDLKMRVERFDIAVDETTKRIEATFEASSTKVVCRRKDGVDDPAGFNMIELATIHANIEKDVLEYKKYPTIRFVSTSVTPEAGGYVIEGDLTLHGVTKRIRAKAAERDGKFAVEYRLHQPDFGIKPYSAMMGALKVQADVIVQVTTPVL